MVRHSPLCNRVLPAALSMAAFLASSVAGADFREQAYLIGGRDLDPAGIASRIEKETRHVLPETIDEAKAFVLREKRLSDSAVAASEARLLRLRERKAEILRMSDARELLATIERKDSSLDQIRSDAWTSLQSVGIKGIYAVVLADSSVKMASKRALQDRAVSILAARAVPDLRGWYLRSSTQVRNSQLVQDWIRMESRGRFGIEEEWLSHPLRQQGKFLYVTKVQVRPLAESATGTRADAGTAQAGIVLDLAAGDSALLASGLAEAEIRRIREALPPGYLQDLRSEQAEVVERTRKIDLQRQQQEERAQNELSELRKQVVSYRERLAEQLAALGRTAPSFLADAYDSAVATVEEEIRAEMARKLAAKELEPVAIWRKIVPSQNEPSKDIATDAMGMVRQLEQSYGRVENFLQVSETRQSMLVRDETLQWRTWERHIDRVWILVVPSDENDYQVSIIGYFRMEKAGELPAVRPVPVPLPSRAARDSSDSQAAAVPLSGEMPAPEQGRTESSCTWCWVGGGLAVGASATAAILLLTRSDKQAADTPVTTRPTSSVEATW